MYRYFVPCRKTAEISETESDSNSDISPELSETESESESDISPELEDILNTLQSLEVGDFVRFFTSQHENSCIGEICELYNSDDIVSAIEIKHYDSKNANDIWRYPADVLKSISIINLVTSTISLF